jgi:predicted nucleotidyltransferase
VKEVDAMRIEKNQLIAGVPARDVRRFMRRAAGFIIRPRTVTHVLGFPEEDARRLLRKFEFEGLDTLTDDHWEATAKGHALAMATAAPPLKRQTAERLLDEVILRARAINSDSRWAYQVASLVVFGSVVTGKERPNDVDIGCKLVQRFTGERQQALEEKRRGLKGTRFANIVECAAWPKLEVLKQLKSRSRGLSIQEFTDWIAEKTDYRIVFRDETESRDQSSIHQTQW